MGKVRILLWDIDGTVLNFLEAEKAAIKKGFHRMNMGVCTDEMIKRYSSINTGYWRKLERGEMTKPEILVARFRDFFEEFGLDVSRAEKFNSDYQLDIGDTICFNDNAFELLVELKKSHKQYAVTNGTAIAQHKKLHLSGLDTVFDGVFISEEIGYEKPTKLYFDKIFEKIASECGSFGADEIMIIGDSLTSDIKGGNNAGILTCWYNPKNFEPDFAGRIDYTISNLGELCDIL